jgi:hypothetical protein
MFDKQNTSGNRRLAPLPVTWYIQAFMYAKYFILVDSFYTVIGNERKAWERCQQCRWTN